MAALNFYPGLAVEVISSTNTVAEMQRKRAECFAGGTRLMWVVYPTNRTIEVFTPGDGSPKLLTAADTLDGGEVLPGFSVVVGHIFERAERPAEG